MRSARGSAVLLALPLLACKPAASSAPLQVPAAPAAPAAAPTAAASPAPSASPASPAPAVVYGHVRIASPTGLLTALRTGPVPEAQRPLFDETFVRSLLSMSLGPRSAVAEHVDLSRPLGCVITSFRQHDVPLACVVGYQGGLSGLVQDLGPQGFVSGTDDYAAYRFEDRAVYLAAMGDHVAFAFAPDLIAATRDRLQRDLVDAPIGDEELVATAFPSVIFTDAREQLLAVVDQIGRSQPPGPGQQAMQEAQRRQWLSWGELERMDLWLDVTPARARLGYRGTARPGTATEQAYAAARTTAAPDRELMARLPAGALATMSMRFDTTSLIDDPMLGAYMQALTSLDGADAALAEQYRQSFAMWRELSTGQAAGALVHERGTKGGVVIAYALRPGVDAATRLREYFQGIARSGSPQLGFTTEVRPGAFRAGKTRGDVITMKPTAAFVDSPGGASVTRLLGDPPRFHMAFAQAGDTLYMAMAPSKVESYLKRALVAGDGKASLGGNASARALVSAHANDTMVVTAGFAAIARWLDQIDVIDPLPFPVVERLDDVVVSMHPAGERQREVTFDLSASMLAALFELGA